MSSSSNPLIRYDAITTKLSLPDARQIFAIGLRQGTLTNWEVEHHDDAFGVGLTEICGTWHDKEPRQAWLGFCRIDDNSQLYFASTQYCIRSGHSFAT